jgi:hypothetical protein
MNRMRLYTLFPAIWYAGIIKVMLSDFRCKPIKLDFIKRKGIQMYVDP